VPATSFALPAHDITISRQQQDLVDAELGQFLDGPLWSIPLHGREADSEERLRTAAADYLAVWRQRTADAVPAKPPTAAAVRDADGLTRA
jgi:hypothetical protein